MFGIDEVSADTAYISRENHTVVDKHGGTAYIPFKETATGKTGGSPEWRKMYHKFQIDNDEFRLHYHERSNVETTFHVLKTKFGDSVNAKNEQAQYAETLLKILCRKRRRGDSRNAGVLVEMGHRSAWSEIREPGGYGCIGETRAHGKCGEMSLTDGISYYHMSQDTAEERIRAVGGRVNSLVIRAITAVVALIMFAVLAFLVYVGRIEAGAMLLFAGVILGYLIHATQEAVR